MEKTIRDIIQGFQNELAKGDLQPDRAAEILTQLAALYGNINDEIRRCDLAYAQVLLNNLETMEKANRAKIKSECSIQFEAKCIARNTKELAEEMMRSLKYLLKAKESEYRAGRYQ
jgi:uncharacterized protein (DUF1501 family)